MTTWRMEGAATIGASLAHNGEREGTTTYFRTEKVVQPDGSVAHIPIGSGNGLRGQLRDISADLLWELMGRPTLSPQVYHFLYSGGQLAKAGSSKAMGSRQLATLRALVPHVGLFGGSGAGRIIESRLAVGKLVPIVAETAHIVPADLLTGFERSIWDYTQIEEFARKDDTHRAHSAAAIDGTRRPQVLSGDDALLAADTEPEPERDGPANQMRYGTQTLPAGLRMHWWLRLSNVTDLEASWFGAVLQRWAADGAVFGGRSNTGHGRLILTHAEWVESRPQLTRGQPELPAAHTDTLTTHVASNLDDIMAHLNLVSA